MCKISIKKKGIKYRMIFCEKIATKWLQNTKGYCKKNQQKNEHKIQKILCTKHMKNWAHFLCKYNKLLCANMMVDGHLIQQLDDIMQSFWHEIKCNDLVRRKPQFMHS